MNKVFIAAVLIVQSVVGYGQVRTNDDQREALDSVQATQDSVAVATTESGSQRHGDFIDYESIRPAPEIFADSVSHRLKDYRIGAQIDSLWKAQLISSDLYPKMQKSILDVPFDDKDFAPLDFKELPTDTLKKQLAYLDSQTPFHVDYNPELERMIHFYLKRNKRFIERLMSLSVYYFPLFEETLDKYDLPLELKYLAIIESALNPKAKSRVGATGLWQFMFTTGKLNNLTVSSYVDERMDPVKSTEAAAKYLSELYGIFDDWNLALAAYNSGPGNVSRAIRRSGGETDYWKLKRYLPRETANYVPAFMAALYVFNYAKDYGFDPYKPKAVYYTTDTIRIKHTIKFKQIAEVTGIDKDLLEFLNPSYKLDIIPFVKGKHYSVRLPIKEAGLFAANEDVIYNYNKEQLADQSLPRYFESTDKIYYRVRRGDYLGRIASRFGVGVSQIRRWNHMRGNRIRIGQRLIIYPKKPVAVAQSKPKKSKSTKGHKVYVVRKGDSLWSISRKFSNVSVAEIKKWNDISNTHLKPGMRLKLSQS